MMPFFIGDFGIKFLSFVYAFLKFYIIDIKFIIYFIKILQIKAT